MSQNKRSLAVYLHWPFCQSKCPYCDFNSHVRASIDLPAWQKEWVRAIGHDIHLLLSPPLSYRVETIFFGGGTPSLMEPALVGAILNSLAKSLEISPDCEITLEANPSSVERQRFKGFLAAGVNRLSLGIQSLDDQSLRQLGRPHNAEDALKAIELAQDIFPRYSLDFIYGLRGERLEVWEARLQQALSLAGDHLSLYQLTIEEGTHFGSRTAKGERLTVTDSQAAKLFQLTQDITEAAGFPAYEISNHARAGGESRHNLAYWRYQEYIGIGPGAHSRLNDYKGNRRAFRQRRLPEHWLEYRQRNWLIVDEHETLTPQAMLTEAVLMGLRLREGLAESLLYTLPPFTEGFNQLNQIFLAEARAKGLVRLEGESPSRRLIIEAKGRLRLNQIVHNLLG